jgi:hypothetical protein
MSAFVTSGATWSAHAVGTWVTVSVTAFDPPGSTSPACLTAPRERAPFVRYSTRVIRHRHFHLLPPEYERGVTVARSAGARSGRAI